MNIGKVNFINFNAKTKKINPLYQRACKESDKYKKINPDMFVKSPEAKANPMRFMQLTSADKEGNSQLGNFRALSELEAWAAMRHNLNNYQLNDFVRYIDENQTEPEEAAYRATFSSED